jgi:hypothetical protein
LPGLKKIPILGKWLLGDVEKSFAEEEAAANKKKGDEGKKTEDKKKKEAEQKKKKGEKDSSEKNKKMIKDAMDDAKKKGKSITDRRKLLDGYKKKMELAGLGSVEIHDILQKHEEELVALEEAEDAAKKALAELEKAA